MLSCDEHGLSCDVIADRGIELMSDVPLKRLLNYNLLFWLSISVFEHFPHYFSSWLFKSEPLSLNVAALLFKELPALLVLALTHYFIRWSYQRPLLQHQLLLGLFGLTLLFIPLNNLTWHLLKTQQPSLQDLLFSQLDTNSLPFFIWGSCYLLYWRLQQQRQQQQQSALLHQQLQQLELQALQHQLNPHFTFNALNSVCALVEAKRYEDAELMSEQLATFLRYSFSKSPDQLVRLEDEVLAIEAYLALQKNRFGDKLQVQWQLDDSLQQQCIPPLLLQPLVENAVKYAVAARRQGATIQITGQRQGQHWQLEVSDNGPGSAQSQTPSTGSGVGLMNIRNRLRQHFGDNASLSTQASASGFLVHIRLPWQESC